MANGLRGKPTIEIVYGILGNALGEFIAEENKIRVLAPEHLFVLILAHEFAHRIALKTNPICRFFMLHKKWLARAFYVLIALIGTTIALFPSLWLPLGLSIFAYAFIIAALHYYNEHVANKKMFELYERWRELRKIRRGQK